MGRLLGDVRKMFGRRLGDLWGDFGRCLDNWRGFGELFFLIGRVVEDVVKIAWEIVFDIFAD